MAHSIPLLEESPSSLDDAGLGALKTERGFLPLVALEVRGHIAGVLARTTVRQTFRNACDVPLEATYIFPLPDRAAVTRFRMTVADRVIEGELKERQKAREEYDVAIEQGHRAAIAEEERSGVFTMRVGNIAPHEDARVELELVGPLEVNDDEATYRFPLVVAPRYTPGVPLDGPMAGDGTAPDTDQVPDASRVSPPVLLPGFPNPVRLSLEVEVDSAGLFAGPQELRASLHSVLIAETGPPWTVRLQPGERLNRDFLLRFPVAKKTVQTALQCSAAMPEKPGVFALTLTPPEIGVVNPRPREVTFVLDRSGSMSGWKMIAARRALGRMIDTLLDHDRFTVIAFDDELETPARLSGDAQRIQGRRGARGSDPQASLLSGSNRDRWRVLEWLGTIDARGGTEMGPALDFALRCFSPATAESDRILVVVTDGQISGEDALLRTLKKAAGKSMPRVFALGIDQAVNAGFLRRLADLGGGTCDLVESEDRLDQALDGVHRRIGQPILTDVQLELVDFDGVAESLAPSRLAGLYAGRPMTIFGRHLSEKTSVRLRIHARDAHGNPWSAEVASQPGPANVLLNLWGRAKVRELEDAYAAEGGHNSKLADRIVAVSLESGVLSRFTAFVAVDKTEVVNEGGKQHKVVQPVEIPAGWSDAVLPAAATLGLNTVAGYCLSSPPTGKTRLLSRVRASRSSAPPQAPPPVESLLESTVDSCLMAFDEDSATLAHPASPPTPHDMAMPPQGSSIHELAQRLKALFGGKKDTAADKSPIEAAIAALRLVVERMAQSPSTIKREEFAQLVAAIEALATMFSGLGDTTNENATRHLATAGQQILASWTAAGDPSTGVGGLEAFLHELGQLLTPASDGTSQRRGAFWK